MPDQPTTPEADHALVSEQTLLTVWMAGFQSGLATALENTGHPNPIAAAMSRSGAHQLMGTPNAVAFVQSQIRMLVDGTYDGQAASMDLRTGVLKQGSE